MTKEEKIFQAAVYGTMAFKAGIKCAPCLDKNLLSLLEGNKVGEGVPVMKAWSEAWHNANLFAEV